MFTSEGGFWCLLNGCVTTGVNIYFGSRTKLTVEPRDKSEPKYHELKANGTNGPKVCLATDFSSHNATDNDPRFPKNNIEATRITGDNYFSKAVIMSTGDTCPITGMKQCKNDAGDGYEPDEKLNFLSLSVLCLRILFLKTIVFNVLMTIRVWMR
ncbi:hypothetical protein ACEWY4_007061 [Coilia grayii]|uniref:Uncharacterized protein n=1 Tax=Coilia grayii TaxID=363190 RepID=A0ABD1KFG1_9TELE